MKVFSYKNSFEQLPDATVICNELKEATGVSLEKTTEFERPCGHFSTLYESDSQNFFVDVFIYEPEDIVGNEQLLSVSNLSFDELRERFNHFFIEKRGYKINLM